jgi:hypothetical protein
LKDDAPLAMLDNRARERYDELRDLHRRQALSG